MLLDPLKCLCYKPCHIYLRFMHKLYEDSNVFLLRAQICYISVEELQKR